MDKNVIEILSRIDKSVVAIATSLKPQNDSGKGVVSKLSKGDVTASQPSASPTTLSTASIGDIIKILSSLSPSVKNVAKLDGKTMKSFKKVIDLIIKSMKKISAFAKNNKDTLEGAKNIIQSFDILVKGISKLPLLIPMAPLAVVGLLLTIPVFLAYGLLMNVISMIRIPLSSVFKMKNFIGLSLIIVKFVLSALLIVSACLLLGYILMSGPTKKLVFGGLIAMAGVFIALIGLTIISALASKMIKRGGAMKGIKEIIVFTLGAMLVLVATHFIGLFIELHKDTILTGLIYTAGVMLGLVFIGWLVGRALKSTNAMKAYGQLLLYAFGAMLIIVAAKFLGDFVLEHYESITYGLLCTGGVMLGLIGIGWLARKLLSKAKKGIVALAIIEGVALGAMVVIFAASKLSDEISGKGEEIALTVLGCMGVITAFGALAALASFIAPEIMVGSVALLYVEAFALGSVLLMISILKFHQTMAESNTSWEDIGKDVLGMEAIIGSFGILAAAFGLAIIPISLAIPGMLAVTKFANSCISITNEVLNINKAIKNAGGITNILKTVQEDMPKIIESFNGKNFDPKMSLFEIGALIKKYKALSEFAEEVGSVAESIAKISQIAGVIDENGRISPVISIDKKTGNVQYGPPVDIVNIATSITAAMKAFVDGCDYGFKDVMKMFAACCIFEMLGLIINPLSAFVNMLTGYVGGTDDSGNNTLAPVTIDKEGNIKIGQPVDINKVATCIVGAVGSFLGEIYKKENINKWTPLVYGAASFWDNMFHGGKNKKTQALMEVAGILGAIMGPLAQFVDMITSVSGSSNGITLSKIIIDKDGNAKAGAPVNVVDTAKSISGAITSFVNEIYGGVNVESWKSMLSDGGETFNAIIESINKSAGALKTFSSDSDINLDKINANVGGLNSLFGVISTALTTIDSGKYTKFNNTTATMITNLSSNKMDVLNTKLSTFNTTIKTTSSNLSEINKVLIEERENRKKAIDEFKDSIEELLEKFSGADDSIRILHDLIIGLQTMDGNKVSQIIRSLNINGGGGYSSYSSPTTPQPQNAQNQNVHHTQVIQTPGVTIDELRTLLDSLCITQEANATGSLIGNQGNGHEPIKFQVNVE